MREGGRRALDAPTNRNQNKTASGDGDANGDDGGVDGVGCGEHEGEERLSGCMPRAGADAAQNGHGELKALRTVRSMSASTSVAAGLSRDKVGPGA